MITSILHKGLRKYYEEANGQKLPPSQLKKIKRIFDILDAISSERDIKSLGLGIHKLTGQYSGFWALTVTGNYRVIFRFSNGDVYDVDYLDYH